MYVYVSITLLRTIDKHRARWRGTGNRAIILVNGRGGGKVVKVSPSADRISAERSILSVAPQSCLANFYRIKISISIPR